MHRRRSILAETGSGLPPSSTIYSDPEFHAHIQSLSARLPTYAESAHDQARDRAIDVIRTSVCDLWMVWQRAWERQEWPIK